jgi:hypothetical protein
MEDPINILSSYESMQLSLIEKWKNEAPGIVSKAIGWVLTPVTWVIQKIVPQKAIQGAIDAANQVGQWLTDTKDIIRDGKVNNIDELRHKDLELSDKLANEVHNWAIGIAAAEGAGAGAVGILSAPLDIPAVITLVMRTIHKIGICYGYECKTQEDKLFVLTILAASGANSMEEKVAALVTLRQLEVIIAKQTWKTIGQKAVNEKLSKEAAIIGIKNLAKQLGVNLTKRKAMAAIPVIGAAVGGSVNGWYLKEVGWAARRAFQERWLIDNNKIIDI